MIYERNFITNIRDAREAPASNPSTVTPSRTWVSCPPEALKTDSGTVQTVNAPVIWRVTRLKCASGGGCSAYMYSSQGSTPVSVVKGQVCERRINRVPDRWRSAAW